LQIGSLLILEEKLYFFTAAQWAALFEFNRHRAPSYAMDNNNKSRYAVSGQDNSICGLQIQEVQFLP
jgi:hypothetical protein